MSTQATPAPCAMRLSFSCLDPASMQTMNTTPPRNRAELSERTALVLLAILVFIPYLLINQLTADWPAHDLSTPLDRAIPLQAAWELIYVSIYFYMFIPVVYLRDQAVFRRAVFGFCLMQVICYAFFLGYPVGIDRPRLNDLQENFLHWGLALNYVLDQPRNLFPSLHLANAFMVSLLMQRAAPAIGWPALIWASLIGYSTLAAKHHFIADVIAGIGLALIIDRYLFRPLIKGPLPASSFYPRRNLALLIFSYPACLLLFFVLWASGWQGFDWPPR